LPRRENEKGSGNEQKEKTATQRLTAYPGRTGGRRGGGRSARTNRRAANNRKEEKIPMA